MTVPMLPSPEPGDNRQDRKDDNHGHEGEEGEHHPHARGPQPKRRVASEEECLAALSSLPALVALGIMTTAQANSIRSTYTTILQHHQQQRAADDRGGVVNDAAVEALVRHPELATLLEPMMSAEQIASLLARARESTRGTA